MGAAIPKSRIQFSCPIGPPRSEYAFKWPTHVRQTGKYLPEVGQRLRFQVTRFHGEPVTVLGKSKATLDLSMLGRMCLRSHGELADRNVYLIFSRPLNEKYANIAISRQLRNFDDAFAQRADEGFQKRPFSTHCASRDGYTQALLVVLLDEYQPSVSNLLKGRISQVSIEKLLRYADRLHLETSIAVRPMEAAPRRRKPRAASTARRAARKDALAV
jgi:hypothetical protein